MDFSKYFDILIKVAFDEEHRAAIARAVEMYMVKKEASLRKLKVEHWSEELRKIRRESIDRLDELVKQASESMKEQGMEVHAVEDGEKARELVLKLMEGEKELLKVKSLASEEIELNEYLESYGIKVYETDVGAILLQLLRWKPSHPTGVCITVSRTKAAEAYSKLAGEKLPADPKQLVSFIRKWVRSKALEVKVALSGANAIAADVGLIYLLTNEANDRLVTTLAERHIVLAGLEKIMPNREACELYSKVVPVYATGGATVTFMSTIGLSRSSDIERITASPASGPSEIHIILMDNGRRAMAKHPVFKEALSCIKCGSCLYYCPLWNVVGGFFSSEGPYMGGFGTPWTLFTKGLEAGVLQAFSCTLCGRCKDACPMGIDIPKLILKVRELAFKKGLIPPQLKVMVENIMKRGTPYMEG